MRPPADSRSHFRYPLDLALGSPSGVRILRTLSLQHRALTTPELATQTRLNESGIRRALKPLIDEGLVESSGGQRGATYQLAATHPLRASLDALFDSEAQRVSRVLDAVRHAAESMSPPVEAVWLYGSVARGDDQPGSDIDLAIVTRHANNVEAAVEALRNALSTTEAAERVNISMLGLSGDDVLRLAGGDPWWTTARSDAIPLVGAAPDAVRQRLAGATVRRTARARGQRA